MVASRRQILATERWSVLCDRVAGTYGSIGALAAEAGYVWALRWLVPGLAVAAVLEVWLG